MSIVKVSEDSPLSVELPIMAVAAQKPRENLHGNTRTAVSIQTILHASLIFRLHYFRGGEMHVHGKSCEKRDPELARGQAGQFGEKGGNNGALIVLMIER